MQNKFLQKKQYLRQTGFCRRNDAQSRFLHGVNCAVILKNFELLHLFTIFVALLLQRSIECLFLLC